MAYLSNLEVEFVGILQGQICFTQLEYHKETAITAPGIPAMAVQWGYGTVWAVLKLCMSEEFTLLEIRARLKQTPSTLNQPEFVLYVNETGSIEAEALPAFATAVIVKVPDNLTKEPEEALDFRVGRASFSGVPETHQEGGLLTPTAVGLWEDVAEAIELIELDETYAFNLGLERGEVNPDKVLCFDAYVRQNLGTQNSRKR